MQKMPFLPQPASRVNRTCEGLKQPIPRKDASNHVSGVNRTCEGLKQIV